MHAALRLERSLILARRVVVSAQQIANECADALVTDEDRNAAVTELGDMVVTLDRLALRAAEQRANANREAARRRVEAKQQEQTHG